MSTQLTNGNWTEIEEMPEALKTLFSHLEEGTAKRFVVGDHEEIKKEQQEIDKEETLKELCERVTELERQNKPSPIISPGYDDIIRFGD